MRLRLAAATITLAASLAAQTTHVVGPGGFATINAALAAAAPGDVLLVQPGSYAGFTATIGVTIRGATAGAVFVTSLSTVNSPAQAVHLLDLDLKILAVTASTCSLDRCRVIAIQGVNGACLSANDSRVHLNECVVGAPGDPPQVSVFTAGLMAITSTVSAVDCTIRGRDRDVMALGGATPGIMIFNGSTFHGSRLMVMGGSGLANVATSLPGPALSATPDSTAWISDSTLAGGLATNVGSAPWQCPVDASAGRLVRCTLLPSTCSPPFIPQTGELLGVHRAAPLQAGAPLQLDFHTEPNGFVGVFASLGLASLTIPELEQPAALDLATLIPLAVVIADNSGLATGAWLLPPGTSNLTLWLQGVTPGALPLKLSPVTGGVVR